MEKRKYTRRKLKNLPALEEYRKGVRMLSKEEIENKIKPIGERLQDKINRLSEENFRQSQYIEQLESEKQKLIEKLEKDIVNITKTMQDGKHCDDYSRCRLKAYRTKTKEILSILKGVENEFCV